MCRENARVEPSPSCKKINKTAATVCKWENGKIEPYGDTLLQLCEIYNVDITTFYGVTTDNNKMRITPQEIELIKLFRNATKHAQIATKTVLKKLSKNKGMPMPEQINNSLSPNEIINFIENNYSESQLNDILKIFLRAEHTIPDSKLLKDLLNKNIMCLSFAPYLSYRFEKNIFQSMV